MLIEGGTLKNSSMRGLLATAPDAVRFIAAGRGTFTLESVTTGSRFTYKVTASEDKKVLFVKLLTGADNTNSYTYIGFIRARDLSYAHGAKSPVKATAGSVLAIRWALERLAEDVLPKTLRVWHEGKCGRCGRKLTVPASVATGFGPECADHVGVEWAVPVCEAA